MTTSGVTAFGKSTNDIVRRALRQIGVVAAGETPDAASYADGKEALNALIKTWQVDGTNLWRKTEDSLTLTASQASYTFGSGGDKTYRPLRFLSVRSLTSASATELPCVGVSRHEYFDGLVNKAATGQPNSYYYDPQVGTGVLYLWPAPYASTYSINFTYAREIEIFDNTTDTPDLPVEWVNALTWNLAVELAPEYGKTVAPAVIAKAVESRDLARGWDQDMGPIQFRPAWRGR